MRLRSRLLLGALAVVAVQVIVVMFLVQQQLGAHLRDDAIAALEREAALVAAHWTADADAAALAVRDGRALGHRVVLRRPDGSVAGDSDPDRAAMPVAPGDELHATARTERGEVMVSMLAVSLTDAVARTRRIVVAAGLVSLAIALIVAWTLATRIARPVGELTEVAGAIAAGDLSRRASIATPGELGALALALRELSEQLATRDAARLAYEALLEQLTESLNEGIVGVDAARRVVRINATGRRLIGVRDALPFSVDLIPRDRALRDALDSAFDGDTTEGSETSLHGRTVSITARPLEAAGGGVVLALLDLTRVRRLEAVRRDFVANVSHELRTPLTIVSGFAETLVHDDLDPAPRKQFAQRILVNTQRMQRIVDDLLDLSRIESGTWVPNRERVELDIAAAEAIALARDAADSKKIALTSDIATDARHVDADPTAIRQIIGNLVDNAVRHTTSGTITVFSRRLTDGGVALGVRDTGAGIPPEHLPRIFERFYRVDAGRSRDQGGTGLGLSIVRLLAEAHEGTVRAESTVGRGTTVTVEFPLVEDAG